jgi:Arc/MetJ-type ribon-helix-helix transcriptional regulator
MSLVLDPATEARIQQALSTGPFREPAELLAHALDLVEAERASLEPADTEMEDWLLRNKDAISADLDETFAQAARGEGYSLEESKALLAESRARRLA